MPKFSNPRAPLAMERDTANRPLDWGLQDVIDDREDAMASRGPDTRLQQFENNILTDNPYFQWLQRDGRVSARPLLNIGRQRYEGK